MESSSTRFPGPPEPGPVGELKRKGKPLEAKGGASEGKEKKGLGVGLGLGVSISSRKPPLQIGQLRSEVGEGVRETVRSHWWQK